jgi:hypothetical protein
MVTVVTKEMNIKWSESEKIRKNFNKKKIDTSTFLQDFITSRKQYHELNMTTQILKQASVQED